VTVQNLPTPTFGGGYAEPRPRMGFFTDTSVCIGCKACEVACKEWNLLPTGVLGFSGKSFDNTLELNAETWRHVAFVEQRLDHTPPLDLAGSAAAATEGATGATVQVGRMEGMAPGNGAEPGPTEGVRWLMSSDVCKHCTSAACMEVCPTGALFRTEIGSVVVQPDICNGCGYCVPACPFGVIGRAADDEDGRAWKCTLCYDRTRDGLEPACAKACPTDSIQYGPLDELRARADARLGDLQARGESRANLYLADSDNGIHGAGAFFLLLDKPEVYGFPPDPVSTTRDVGAFWKAAGLAAGALLAGVAAAFAGGRR
jgi:formate dehydrogenase iron-sulfur subunit